MTDLGSVKKSRLKILVKSDIFGNDNRVRTRQINQASILCIAETDMDTTYSFSGGVTEIDGLVVDCSGPFLADTGAEEDLKAMNLGSSVEHQLEGSDLFISIQETLERQDVENFPGLIESEVHEVATDASMREKGEG